MNERQSFHHSQSKVFCRNFLGLWQLIYWKIHVIYRRRIAFLRGKENQYTKKKTESYVSSGFGNGISRGWEQKDRQLEDLPQPDLAVYLKDFFCR